MWLGSHYLGQNQLTFRAPEPLPILNPRNFVPKNGFPVVKGLTPSRLQREKIDDGKF